MKKALCVLLAAILTLSLAPAALSAPPDNLGFSPGSGLALTQFERTNMITGVTVTVSGTPVSQIEPELLPAEGLSVAVLNSDGQIAAGDQPLSTNMRAQLRDQSGNALEIYPFVVTGDVTGTGRLTIAQLTRLAAQLSGQAWLEGPFLLAADVNRSGACDIADLTALARMLANPEPPRPAEGDFSSEEFANPSIEYRPGVRWWWPGGAVETDKLLEQVEYLAENNYGSVEINPFYVETILPGDEEAVLDIYTPSFYEKLEAVVEACEERGIVVDLNMGSGYCANTQDVSYEDSMGNMALGRATVSGEEAGGPMEIPAAERSAFYAVSDRPRMVTYPREPLTGEWRDDSVVLQGVLFARIAGTGTPFEETQGMFGPTPAVADVYDAEGEVVKTYDAQVVLDREGSVFIPADDPQIQDGTLTLSDETAASLDPEAEYEIAAMYGVPSGGQPFRSAVPWFAVDHMDAAKVADYMNDWLGNERLTKIVESHDNVRGLFNDSYEFRTDVFYNDVVYEKAGDAEGNGLGYDFTPYLPTIYRQLAADFFDTPTADTFLTFATDEAEKDRIYYDYGQLVNEAFQEGMAAFQEGSNAYGLQYRQQPYNPPIDVVGAAKYVDIPETEQAAEMSLIRVASGAHLYGRDLVTAEQYTLGNVPLTNTPGKVKCGVDIMATGGVNNFFYHGLNYPYGVGSEEYGEIGWSPWPAIGINNSALNTLAPCFGELNKYAARVNYMMQTGKVSKDVAYYLPFDTELSLTDPIVAMNTNGIAWDAINDDSIQSADTRAENGKISVNGGVMTFDMLVVESDSLPVATLEKIRDLARDGATVVFYGEKPSRQPSYCGGNYEPEDAKAAAAADAAVSAGALVCASGADFAAALNERVDAPVSYAPNDQVRFFRRTQSDGSELVFIRNLADGDNEITITVDPRFDSCYWLDQNDGGIYPAEKNANGEITAVFHASEEAMSTSMMGGTEKSMALGLICLAEGSSLVAPQSARTEGTPDAIDPRKPEATSEVQITKLEANGGSFEGDILGLWNSADFQQGALKNFGGTGVYTGTFTAEEIGSRRVRVRLNGCNTAARVKVNGQDVGLAMYSPYYLDITDAARPGENTIEISVTSRLYNQVHPDVPDEDLVDTGLAGPVLIEYVAA